MAVRDNMGRFRTSITSAYSAGWDSVEHGPDLENCSYRWFGSPESAKEWELGRDNALKKLGRE